MYVFCFLFSLLLQEQWKDYPLFQAEVFQTEAFKDFQTELLEAMGRSETPHELLLREYLFCNITF